MSHIDQILGKGFTLEVFKIRYDDCNEKVDHRDGPKDDQGNQNDHGKNPLGVVVIFKGIIKGLPSKLSKRPKTQNILNECVLYNVYLYI